MKCLFQCNICQTAYLSSKEALDCENQNPPKPLVQFGKLYQCQLTGAIGRAMDLRMMSEGQNHYWIIRFNRVMDHNSGDLNRRFGRDSLDNLVLIDTQIQKM